MRDEEQDGLETTAEGGRVRYAAYVGGVEVARSPANIDLLITETRLAIFIYVVAC